MKYKNRADYEKNKVYLWKDNCPFCIKLDKSKIIFESDFWFVMPNDNPYFLDNNCCLMAFPKRHSEFTIELSEDEFGNLLEVDKFMKSFFKGKEYFSMIRQSKSNKSVEHLHYHYLTWIPSIKENNWEKYFKVRYKL